MRLLAALRSMNDSQVMLQVLKGSFGANKTYWVSRPGKKVSCWQSAGVLYEVEHKADELQLISRPVRSGRRCVVSW